MRFIILLTLVVSTISFDPTTDIENNIGDEANEMGDNLLPVDLGSGKTAKQITTGQYHTCAILNDDSVKCWGYNHVGQLSTGSGNIGDEAICICIKYHYRFTCRT